MVKRCSVVSFFLLKNRRIISNFRISPEFMTCIIAALLSEQRVLIAGNSVSICEHRKWHKTKSQLWRSEQRRRQYKRPRRCCVHSSGRTHSSPSFLTILSICATTRRLSLWAFWGMGGENDLFIRMTESVAISVTLTIWKNKYWTVCRQTIWSRINYP